VTRTYKATGINLKSAPIGESDRVLTVLTREFGLIRAVAPGVRKHRSTIGGRSELFVVNELLIAKGRSLDKITQADTVQSHPGLSRNLGKLAAAQYLAELAIASALSDEPQEELF
jgi:DNA repair protein RecO (recombination protein O)